MFCLYLLRSFYFVWYFVGIKDRHIRVQNLHTRSIKMRKEKWRILLSHEEREGKNQLNWVLNRTTEVMEVNATSISPQVNNKFKGTSTIQKVVFGRRDKRIVNKTHRLKLTKGNTKKKELNNKPFPMSKLKHQDIINATKKQYVKHVHATS